MLLLSANALMLCMAASTLRLGVQASNLRLYAALMCLCNVPDDRNELLHGAAVAIAEDGSKRTSELGPDDWELLPLIDIMEG